MDGRYFCICIIVYNSVQIINQLISSNINTIFTYSLVGIRIMYNVDLYTEQWKCSSIYTLARNNLCFIRNKMVKIYVMYVHWQS